MAWSLITEQDFIESGAIKNDIAGVTNELISTIPGVEIIILMYQQKNNVYIIAESLKNINSLYLIKQFTPWGDRDTAYGIVADISLTEAENKVINTIKENLNRLLNP